MEHAEPLQKFVEPCTVFLDYFTPYLTFNWPSKVCRAQLLFVKETC